MLLSICRLCHTRRGLADRRTTRDSRRMPVFALPDEHIFPDPRLAREDGLLAVGGDLHPRRLLLGYTMGIFPWYNEGQPILWHSPDPRFVLLPEQLKVQRSLRKVIRRQPYRLTMDRDFATVIDRCARTPSWSSSNPANHGSDNPRRTHSLTVGAPMRVSSEPRA